MLLFSLPCDIIRAILQGISLQDITRLIIATNNRQDSQILKEAIDTLQYEPQRYHSLSESFYDWARKIGIHLTHIWIYNLSCAQVNYLREMREFVLGITISRTDSNSSKLHKKIPLLMESFPNLTSIISNNPLVFDDMTAQQGLLLLSTTVSNCAILIQLPNLLRLRCVDISLTVDEAEIIIGSCPHLEYLSTTSDNYDGLQYLMHSSLDELTINSKIPITPPPFVRGQYLTESNIITLTVEMNPFDSILIDIIADNCTKLEALDIQVITGYYTIACDTVIAKLLSNCKWLKKFSYKDNAKKGTATNPAANILHSLFDTDHGRLASLSIKQGTVPITRVDFNAILTPMPNLKKIYLDGPLSRSFVMLLSGCTSLVHLDYDSTIPDSTTFNSIDVKLLYNACPRLRSIRYTGTVGHMFIQHSHEHLELLTIIGDINDKYNSAVNSITYASFPSLKQLKINGNLDPNSWTRIMMSTNMKGVHKLVLSDANIISDSKHSIIDSILHHANFSNLRVVCCAKDVAGELRTFAKWFARDIEISHYIIFSE